MHAKKPRDRNNNVAATAREAAKRALRVKKEKNEGGQIKQEIKQEPSTSTLVRGPHDHKLAHNYNHNCRLKLRQVNIDSTIGNQLHSINV